MKKSRKNMKKSIEAFVKGYYIERTLVEIESFKDKVAREYLIGHTPQDMDLFYKELDEIFEPYMDIPKVVFNLYDRHGLNGWNIPEDIEHGFLSEHDVDGLTIWHYYDGFFISEAVDEYGRYYEGKEADELIGC